MFKSVRYLLAALCGLASALVLALALAGGQTALAQPTVSQSPVPQVPGAGDPVLDAAGLLPGLQGRIGPDGRLDFLAAGTDRPILSVHLTSADESTRDRRFAGAETRFTSLASEGMTAGARGFSDQADDDRDGATDEDPLDGQDNDRDGGVDEDFAAIGDTMVVVHSERAGRSLHQEFYRWTNGYLHPAVFLSARQAGRVGGSGLRITAGDGWVETGITYCLHSISGQPHPASLRAFVTKSGPGESAQEGIWLGAMVLDQEKREGTGFRILLADERLDIPLAEEPVPLVVCAAESWSQLCNLLGEAARVYHGVTDPVSGLQAGWIVPARCVRCRLAEPPDFRWTWTVAGGVMLWADAESGSVRMLDPDLFRVNGRSLGSPVAVSWTPESGAGLVMPWAARTLADLRTGAAGSGDLCREIPDWYRHDGGGRVGFRFEGLPPEARDVFLKSDVLSGEYSLTCVTLGGRPLTVALSQDAGTGEDLAGRSGGAPGGPGSASAGATSRSGTAADPLADRSKLRLSPDLLRSWPNPFRDQIQVQVRIPQTLQEAFVWDDGAPAGVDLQAGMPWAHGQPQVTVKVYSIDGQELATLFSGRDERGEFTITWDARDSSGRRVASGAYFCKLQLDDLSVTRRIVYLR